MSEIIVLRLVHVLGGVFWVGSALFNTFFLFPAMKDAGPAAGAIMGSMRRRNMFVVLPLVAVITILAGVRLMMITSGNFSAEYFASGRGATFAWSGTAAIAAFVLGMVFHRPMGMRMGKLQQALAGATDDATRADLTGRIAALQRGITLMGYVLNALLVIAAGGMAIARYVA